MYRISLLFLFAFVSLLICQSCSSKTDQTARQSSPDSQSTVASTASDTTSRSAATGNDFLIIPDERVGPITSTTSEADLIKLLGPSVVTAGDTMYGPEGDTFLGTTLYKGTSNETQITYTDSTRTRPEYVKVRPQFLDDDGNPIKHNAPTRWKTANDIRIGTTLNELEKRNGKPFKLWGFGWDYGGTLSNWQGGKMAPPTKKSPIALTFGPPITMTPKLQNAYDAVSGDGEFLSSGANMQLLNPIVVAIGVGFGQ